MFFVTLGLAVFFVVETIRRLPPFEKWVLQGKRPWACNLCMSFWVGNIVGISAHAYGLAPLSALGHAAGLGFSLLLLEWSASFIPPAGPNFS